MVREKVTLESGNVKGVVTACMGAPLGLNTGGAASKPRLGSDLEAQEQHMELIETAKAYAGMASRPTYDLNTFSPAAMDSIAMPCIIDHLALFLQLHDGDIFDDERISTDRIEGLFYAIEPIFMAIADANKKGLIPEGRRLLVIQSDFYGKGWGWIQEGQKVIDPKAWHSDENMLQAINAIL